MWFCVSYSDIAERERDRSRYSYILLFEIAVLERCRTFLVSRAMELV